jgi:nucleotide-binding universal stress UspA family protein
LQKHSETIEKKIKIFEKAVDIKKIKLNPIKIKKILLAIDAHSEATEINENALQITSILAKKAQSEVFIICIAPTAIEIKISEKLVGRALKTLEKENIKVIGTCEFGHPSEKILEISNRYNPNLIILPTPYGERAEPFNIDSLGTSVDIILRKSPIPTLLVKKPKHPPNKILSSILLIIDSNKSTKAAEWALSLTKENSSLMLLTITEKETIEKVEELAKSVLEAEIDKDLLENIHKKENIEYSNKIIDDSRRKDIKIEKKHIIGDKIRLILRETEEKHTILVIGTTIEQDDVFEHEVENICRLIRIPILLVKN